MQDPEFLADAKKIQIDVNPVSAAAVEKLIGDLYATPDASWRRCAVSSPRSDL